jgi:membrane protein
MTPTTVVERPGSELRHVVRYARRHGAARIAHDVLEAASANRLLTYASAVSFQVVFALIPLLLASVAVLGFFDLAETWSETLAPRLEERVSDPAYAVIDRSVQSVLGSQRSFWLTLGAALALWELSGAVRAVMGALNEIFDADESRPFLRRFGLSFALAVALALLLGLAAAAIQVVPQVARYGDWGGLGVVAVGAAWLLALVLMAVAVGLTMRFAPAKPQSMGWVGFGTVTAVGGWVVASLAFAAYATRIASYSTVYGSLGVVILLLTYVYVSTLVFLGAAQAHALVRRYAGDAR